MLTLLWCITLYFVSPFLMSTGNYIRHREAAAESSAVLPNPFPFVYAVKEKADRAQIADVQSSEAPLNRSCDMAIQNKSECVPVCRKSSVSSVSFCCHVINQSGSMWHSQQPLNCPESLWWRYLMGSVPVVLSRAIASSINCKSRPRFWQRFKSFLKRLV